MIQMKKSGVILLCMLFFTACAQLTSQQKKEDLGINEFRVGNEGLRAVFVTNLPPDRIFGGENLDVTLQIENKGTSPVIGENSRIYLSGFDPSIITGVPTTGIQLPKIHPRDQFTSQGSIEHISFQGKTISLENKGIDKYPARLQATLCYGYETIASANVCLDPNPFSATIRQKVCTPASVGLGGGQGAPIAVTMVEIDPALGKTRFRIKVQNVGGGEVFRPSALDKCSPFSTEGLRFNDVDYIKVRSIRMQDKDIKPSCNPMTEQHLRLTNNAGTLFCEITGLVGTAAYISPLIIELEYGYRTTFLKSVDLVPGS